MLIVNILFHLPITLVESFLNSNASLKSAKITSSRSNYSEALYAMQFSKISKYINTIVVVVSATKCMITSRTKIVCKFCKVCMNEDDYLT